MYTIEEFDQQKTKVMNYIMYKKRTEREVRNKFEGVIEENMLEDIIQYVKDAGYLSDIQYIQRAIREYQSLKNLSIKEIKYKLISKGITRNDFEDYLSDHREDMEEYEQKSANNIARKKKSIMDQDEIREYLFKKGYQEESIRQIDWEEL